MKEFIISIVRCRNRFTILILQLDSIKAAYDVAPEDGMVVVETPKDTKLGDYATSAAMKLSRVLRKNPMDIGEALAGELRKLLPEDIPSLLARGDRRLTGPTMPPQGLYLNQVWYEGPAGELFLD